jgi:iron complex outermembrane recepter protein
MVRAVGSYQDRDGYTHDVVWNKDRDNMHWYSGRIGITFKPTERIENYLLAFGAKSRNNGSAYIHRGFNIPGLQAFGFCSDPGTPPSAGAPFGTASCDVYRRQTELQDGLGKRKVRYDVDEFEQTKTWGLTNTTNFELTDELTLRNIFSYQRYKMNFADDYDATPLQQTGIAPINLPNFPIPGLTDEFGIPPLGYLNEAESGPRDNLRQITEELQLQGDMLDKHLTFTVGAFYYHQKPVSEQLVRTHNFCPAAVTGLCAPSFQSYAVTNKSRALYGQATLDLGAFSPALEKLRLTGGYRYTWDSIRGNTSFYLPGIDPTDPSVVLCLNTSLPTTDPSTCQFGATLKTKAPTWRLGVDYQAMSNLLLFATVNRGYKAGGFNPYAVRPETRTFTPEKVTSYEAGFKSDWNLGSVPLRLNLTAYTMDYKNIQRAVGDANGNAIGAAIIPASARIRGVELETSIRPIRAVEIGGNLSYTDARFKEFNVSALGHTVFCGPVVGGRVDQSCLNFGIPKWTYSAHASIDAPLPDDLGKLNFYANYAWIGRSVQSAPFFPEEQPGSRFSSYGLLNLSASWQNIGQRGLDATLFMTNATNKLYKVSNSNTFQAAGGTLSWSELYGEPRMYGLRLRYRFGE